MRSLILLTVVAAAAFFADLRESHAQRPSPNRYYSPSGPTITPYLDYFRRPDGVLDRYNQWVQPHRQRRDTLQRQDNSIRRLQTTTRNTQMDLQATQENLLQLKQSTAPPTGIGATYMNYSHYYPGK